MTEESKSTIPANARNVSLPAMGLPASSGDLHIVNRFKGNDPRNLVPFIGTPGDYQVTFILQRPGFNLLPEGQYSFSEGLEGDSHLGIVKPAYVPPFDPDATNILIYGRTEDGAFQFEGFPNKRGFLGKIKSAPFHAKDRQDAKRKAYRALMGTLSNWSVHLDIPLHVNL